MNVTIEQTNAAGRAFVEFALPMLIQSGLLILILLSVDLLLRRKVRAVFRYWMWMLVLAKLLLPTSLSSPVSVGHWFDDELAYLDMTAAPTAEAKVDITPMPAAESPTVTDIKHVGTTARAPAIATTEPTARPFEPVAPEPLGPFSLPSPAVTPLSWQAMALLIWLAVVVAMTLLLLQRAFFVRRLVAQAQEANRAMKEMLAYCCQRMGVRRGIELKISASATSPAVCGLFNPVILMPKNLAPSLSSGELRVVLLHELAHIRRGDLWVNLAATILQIFYFYNPLLWLANAMIRRAREQAVDEMVLVAMGDNAPQYPQTLLSVAKMAFKRPALSLRLTGVVESRSALAGRIKHILNRPMPKTAKLGIIGLAVVLAAAAVLLPMAAFLPGPPELVVKGTVIDVKTGKPIAGARVFDDGYGPTPAWDQIRPGERSEWGAITNAAGEYSFLTWPEHHSVSAEAPGYTLERESLYENHFTVNDSDEQTMNFVLVPMAVTAPAKEGIGTDSVGAESVVVPILGYDVKLEGSDGLFTVHGTVTDDSGSPVEGVQLTADCGHGKLERTGRTVTDKNGRYTLGLTSSIKNPGADPYDVGIQAARIKARARGFYEVNLCRGGNLAMAGKPPGPDEEQFVAGYAGVVLPHRPYELNFVMRPAARIEGNLVDERDNPVRRKSVWLHGDGLLKYSSLVGSANQDGRFEIDHIPCGTVWFKSVDRQLVESGTVNLPTPGIYRVRLRIGESPTGRPTLRISECHALASSLAQPDQRRVVDPNGNPVAGAQVALCTRDKGVVIRAGKLGPNRMGDRTTTIAETDADGSFDFSDWPDSFHLIAAHDKGFAWVTREQFTASPAIWLQSWSRIEGRLYIGRDAGAGKRMDLLNYINKNAIDRGVRLEYEADTDGEGRFAFNRIPPGWLEIGYLTRMGDSSWSQTGRMPVQIHPGVTLRIAVGGRGRPVVGKFVPPKGYDKPVYFGEGLRALNTVRPDRPKPENCDQMSKRQQQDWYNKWSETSEARTYYDTMWRDPGRRQYVFHIERDGSFRIEDVIAGRYSFTVWIEERLSGQGRPEEIGSYYGSIKVPEMAGGRSDEPLDLGELELSMREPVRVGDAAPLFEARTLDGERVKLSDYRGRFVLLSFWQPVFHPELERLKILAAGYNAVGRLEIIGLGGNDTLEEVKRYVEENDIPWPQIFVGEELGSGIAEDYGIPGMPAIFLVGPDGRIVAKDLRGEKLSSTVLETLESTEQHKTEAPPPFSRDKVTDIRLPFTFTIYTLTPDNKPQPGVSVRCLHPRPERAEPIVDMVVESDENGVAKFTITQADLLTDWMYWFSLDDEDYVGSPGVGITPDEGDWTFKVLPAEEFDLQVIGDKKPVSGATVHLQIDHGEGKDWDPKRFWAYENVVTDSAGQVRVKFVKGRISMAVAAKGYASKMISGAELTDKPYKIELAKGRDITGQVVDPNDKPLASVTVTAKSKGDLPWEEEFLLKASTDRKGSFTLKNASAGKWEVVARSEDPNKPYFIEPVTVNVRRWWRVKPVKMVAEEGFRLKGKYVTDYRINLRHDGGLPQIHVGVTKPSSSWMDLRTNNDGTFDIWGLPSRGRGSIRFVGVGGYHNFVEVPKKYNCFQIFGDRLNFKNIPPATYENIKVHYVLAGMVRGTVVDAAGLIFPGAEITVEPEGTRHKTDEEGKFSIRVAPGDALTLTVRDTQTRAVVFDSEPFGVEEGEVIEKNTTTRYERRN